MAVCEPSSLSAEGFTLKAIPVPSPSVLLNLQLKRCKLRLGSSQDSSKAVRISPWQLRGCSCFCQHKGRETWVCSMGVPSSIRPPPCTWGISLAQEKQHTHKRPRVYKYTFSLPVLVHFHIKESSFSIFNRTEAILELQCIPLS